MYSVGLGFAAGASNQSNYAVAIGYEAGSNAQGSNTVSLGRQAGMSNQASDAIAIGNIAGRSLQGIGSIAIGTNAGSNAQGEFAIAIGDNAIATGNSAIAIGQNTIASGSSAISIGSGVNNSNGIVMVAGGNSLNITDSVGISLGSATFGQSLSIQTNQININSGGAGGSILSDSSGLFINTIQPAAGSYYLTYDTSTDAITYDAVGPSDRRLKTNISNTTLGIELRPVEFTWKDRIGVGLGSDGNALPPKDPGKRKHQGFIAQEVKQVLDTLSTDSALFTCINDIPSTITKTRKDKHGSTITTTHESPHAKLRGLYTLRHEEFIAPTVKAVQDVYAIVQTQQSTIILLEIQVSTLTGKLQAVCSTLNIVI